MTNIVVLIKQVPDTWSERKLSDGDYTLDRDAADAVLDEINERAVEEAVRDALGGLPVGAIEARDGHVAVQCARDAKMAVIAALATLNGKVRDLTVREPSLEDVFFGFSD